MTTEAFVGAAVWASAGKSGGWVDIKEIQPVGKPAYVGIEISASFGVGLKPAEAIKLADQLYELARRVQARK